LTNLRPKTFGIHVQVEGHNVSCHKLIATSHILLGDKDMAIMLPSQRVMHIAMDLQPPILTQHFNNLSTAVAQK